MKTDLTVSSNYLFRCATMIKTVTRRILIDAARQRKSLKYGVKKVSLDDVLTISTGQNQNLLELDNALNELEEFGERQCRIVEFRYFAGLTIEETAEF